MLIIPVIDIKDGQCVRVIEGLYDTTLFYSESPIKVARLFRKENFKTLHITDLDGALHGNMKNLEIVKEIVKSIDIPVQLGGGIRNFDIAQKIIKEIGVYRIVLGTLAVSDQDLVKKLIDNFSPAKIVIGIDEKDNKVVKKGWYEYEDIDAITFARQIETLGIKRIIYQDVSTVGKYSGPNYERLIDLAKNTSLKITAAGGIRDYKDLKKLSEIEKDFKNIDSIMISRALYENKFACQFLWRSLESKDTSLDLPKV